MLRGDGPLLWQEQGDPSDTSIHGGTLNGIFEKFDHLLEFGVTAVWMTMVYENIQTQNNSEPYHYYWLLNFERINKRLLDGIGLPNLVDLSKF